MAVAPPPPCTARSQVELAQHVAGGGWLQEPGPARPSYGDGRTCPWEDTRHSCRGPAAMSSMRYMWGGCVLDVPPASILRVVQGKTLRFVGDSVRVLGQHDMPHPELDE